MVNQQPKSKQKKIDFLKENKRAISCIRVRRKKNDPETTSLESKNILKSVPLELDIEVANLQKASQRRREAQAKTAKFGSRVETDALRHSPIKIDILQFNEPSEGEKKPRGKRGRNTGPYVHPYTQQALYSKRPQTKSGSPNPVGLPEPKTF
mmetsp:Transcript_31559/g.48242  ORF Transcript_31559/g.48242 Transcript_31559/m.48242 type:complete len:152 (+) Transcript_31559:1235-1690(+)|eukprot:CAMPEP_0170503902 /NCGR_PEP_ID=MMETSP0208-20121228/46298_1 /TAXON_ID=197538 /ORGANISM="Strombidium inclinatum, Strain S3" /LENGTH=151 /DNA_ID=CAMNT_0010783823 /DNA_START=1215 /DNA_END=1670 /DNA_ORIENTATION=+